MNRPDTATVFCTYLPGAVTVTAAMPLVVYTVVGAQQAGWGSAQTIGSFAGVATLLAVFAVIESRSKDPLMAFAVFRSGSLRRANLGARMLFGSYISFQIVNNCSVWHARRQYDDAQDERRHLLRVWANLYDGRPVGSAYLDADA
jgi:hypothetical protein